MKTSEAIKHIIRCHIIVVTNVLRDINHFVTRRPWMAIMIIIIGSFLFCSVSIMSARAERDRAQKKQVQLQNEVNRLSCILKPEKCKQ